LISAKTRLPHVFRWLPAAKTEALVSLPDVVHAATSVQSLVDIAEAYHSLPLALLFIFLTLVSTVAMAAKFCLRCLAEVVDAYYDFRKDCANSRRRYFG
jgi:hypothetical protein